MKHHNNQCSGTKVRLMITYGGKLQRRYPENVLFYVGGDTKILVVDRNMQYFEIMTKVIFTCDLNTPCELKYLFPGNKNLDELVSVDNDEDVKSMMNKYDNFHTASMPKRMRLFVLEPTTKSHCVPLQRSDLLNPDYLFGFDKEYDLNAPPEELHVPAFPDKRDFGLNRDNEKDKRVEEKKQLTTEETRGITKTRPCDNNVTSAPTSTSAYTEHTLGSAPLIYCVQVSIVVYQTRFVPSGGMQRVGADVGNQEQPVHRVMTSPPNRS